MQRLKLNWKWRQNKNVAKVLNDVNISKKVFYGKEWILNYVCSYTFSNIFNTINICYVLTTKSEIFEIK